MTVVASTVADPQHVHPAIALDLLAFQTANELLGKLRVLDGPDVEFSRSRPKQGSQQEPTPATRALEAIQQSLPADWLKATSEAARFEAFRSLPQAAKLELLAYCIALTLQPKLGPADGEEATAYDAALALTEASVAGSWPRQTIRVLGITGVGTGVTVTGTLTICVCTSTWT